MLARLSLDAVGRQIQRASGGAGEGASTVEAARQTPGCVACDVWSHQMPPVHWRRRMAGRSVNARVQGHRKALRAAGMRPVQIWVPDTRRPVFDKDFRQQSLLVAQADQTDPTLNHSWTRPWLTWTAGLHEERRPGHGCCAGRILNAPTQSHDTASSACHIQRANTVPTNGEGPASCVAGPHLVGSPTWARTRDLRIDSGLQGA
jgi:hypothetical protein